MCRCRSGCVCAAHPVHVSVDDALLLAFCVSSVAGNPQRLDVCHRSARARVAEARAPIHGMRGVELVIKPVERAMHHGHRLALGKGRRLAGLQLDVVAVEEIDQPTDGRSPWRERAHLHQTAGRQGRRLNNRRGMATCAPTEWRASERARAATVREMIEGALHSPCVQPCCQPAAGAHQRRP